jgi:hypothetical protein
MTSRDPVQSTGEFVTVLVIRHPKGISQEGAVHVRSEALAAVRAIGLDCIAASTEYGDAGATGLNLILGDENA